MIVSLIELKRALGLDVDDTSQDDNLTRIILAKTAWVEGATRRRFDTPIARTEYHDGNGEEKIFLNWHVDDSEAADDSSEWGDPTTSVRVFRRPRAEKWREWEELIEGEDWERRNDTLLFLRTWQCWPGEDEFKIDYVGGYAIAPADIKELIIELSAGQYVAETETAEGSAGLTSEKLGDYSYNFGGASSAYASVSGGLSDMANNTLNRYKRKIV